MPHSGVVFEVASQDQDEVTFTVDLSDASGKIRKDQRGLWVSLTSVDADKNIVVANNLAVVWPAAGLTGSVTFGLPGTQTHNYAYVWEFPDSSAPLATLTF